MKFITFKEVNVVLGKGQPQYQNLPVFKQPNDPEGNVVMCVQFDKEEMQRMIDNDNKCFIKIMTFNNPFQPIAVSVDPMIQYLTEEETKEMKLRNQYEKNFAVIVSELMYKKSTLDIVGHSPSDVYKAFDIFKSIYQDDILGNTDIVSVNYFDFEVTFRNGSILRFRTVNTITDAKKEMRDLLVILKKSIMPEPILIQLQMRTKIQDIRLMYTRIIPESMYVKQIVRIIKKEKGKGIGAIIPDTDEKLEQRIYHSKEHPFKETLNSEEE